MTRVTIRTKLFLRIFSDLKGLFPELYGQSQFDHIDAEYLSQLYFLFSDDYKKWRLEPDHYTNDYKKAGLTVAAIMAMRPICLLGDNADGTRAIFAHPIFAMACATAILNKPVSSVLSKEDRQMFYTWLDSLRFVSAVPFLSDASAQALRDPREYANSLSRVEISHVDMIVQKLKDLCRLYDLEALVHDQSDEP